MIDGVQAKQKGEPNVQENLQFMGRNPCRMRKDTIEASLSPWDKRI